MNPEKISIEKAREMAMQAQLKSMVSPALSVVDVIDKLGYVQIDSINVIHRAHHHTLWARLGNYKREDIYSAQAKDKTVFEYWGHAMSYLPMRDYRFSLPYKEHFNDPSSQWVKGRLEKYGYLMEPALQRIREEGAMATGDFTNEEKRPKGTWWDWRPIKVALEMLFWQGKLMVAERKNFQKIFDLPERVLPEGVDTRMPTQEELGRFLVTRALNAYGIANEKEIIDHLRIAGKGTILKVLNAMLAAGEVVPVLVQNGEEHLRYYMLEPLLDEYARETPANGEVFILSPFDNFCIQRGRMKTLFNFDYALECYLPPAQRSFGYFALPIFWKDAFVGKMDVKAERAEKRLLVHHVKFEEGFKPNAAFVAAFQKKLDAFMRFQGCERMSITQVSPDTVKLPIP